MTDERANTESEVGPVLIAGRIGTAIAQAICELNPQARITDRGSYLRVSAPGTCVLTAAAVEAQVGEPFHIPADLEKVMCSFSGRISISEKEVRWQFSEK